MKKKKMVRYSIENGIWTDFEWNKIRMSIRIEQEWNDYLRVCNETGMRM